MTLRNKHTLGSRNEVLIQRYSTNYTKKTMLTFKEIWDKLHYMQYQLLSNVRQVNVFYEIVLFLSTFLDYGFFLNKFIVGNKKGKKKNETLIGWNGWYHWDIDQ